MQRTFAFWDQSGEIMWNQNKIENINGCTYTDFCCFNLDNSE
jgi:hypothetical protein